MPSATFFLLPTRMWELLTGALLLFCPSPVNWSRVRPEVCSWCGLAGIVIAGVQFDAATPFPGCAALLPCLGTAMIIYANVDGHTSVAALLSLAPVVFVGSISYSLYLWHWPVLAYCRYWWGSDLSLTIRVAALCGSLLAACLSWKFIETPFRRGLTGVGVARLALGAATAAAAVVGVSLWYSWTDGLPGRLPISSRKFLLYSDRYLAAESGKSKVLSGELPGVGTSPEVSGRYDFLVWGDSHAGVVCEVVDSVSKKLGMHGAFVSKGGLVPLVGTTNVKFGDDGLELNDAVARYAAEYEIRNILLVASWNLYIGYSQIHHAADDESTRKDMSAARDAMERGLRRTLTALDGIHARVWIVKQVPDQIVDPRLKCVKAAYLGHEIPTGVSVDTYRERTQLADAIIDSVAAEFESVQVVNLESWCFDDQGNSKIADDEGAFYRDRGHLSALGAERLLRPMFQSILQGISDTSRGRRPSASSRRFD